MRIMRVFEVSKRVSHFGTSFSTGRDYYQPRLFEVDGEQLSFFSDFELPVDAFLRRQAEQRVKVSSALSRLDILYKEDPDTALHLVRLAVTSLSAQGKITPADYDILTAYFDPESTDYAYIQDPLQRAVKQTNAAPGLVSSTVNRTIPMVAEAVIKGLEMR